MQLDLEALSRKELEKLRNDVEKAISTLADREKRAAIAAAEKAVAEFGFTLAQLGDLAASKGKARKTPSVARYRNPADPEQVWSGRGRRPDWINAGLAAGKALSDYAI